MAVIPSEGTILEMETATPGTYAAMGQVIKIGAQAKTVAAIKTTLLTSTSQQYRPGKIPDNGDVTFRIQYDPNEADHIALFTALDAGTVKNWHVKYADGNTTKAMVAFAGFLTSVKEDDKEDEANVEADVTIQITGTPVRTAGTP